MTVKKPHIIKYIVLPVIIVIALILTGLIIGINRYHYNSIEREHVVSLEETRRLFQMEIDEDARFLNGLLDLLKNDKTLQNARLANDKTALLEYAQPFFKHYREKYNVTHFYVHGLDKICFMRVHNPTKNGDLVTRFTLAETVRQNKPFYGIELGKYGTFTLRVLQPWYADGELIGYLELGEEIEHITLEMKNILGSEIIFIIEKQFLEREKWEAGLKIFNKIGNWNEFDDFVFIDSTIPQYDILIGRKSSSIVPITKISPLTPWPPKVS